MNIRIVVAFAAVVLSAVAVPSFASDAATAAAGKLMPMRDGGTIYVFKDGKMAVGDKDGRAVSVEIGKMIETADGSKITMSSNEVARLDVLLIKH